MAELSDGVDHGLPTICMGCGMLMCELDGCAEHKTHSQEECIEARTALVGATLRKHMQLWQVHAQATAIVDELMD
ncbi:MAG: hypothetical protein F4169_20900 [Gammaproteobacteria bacterium]|nr:hypothetical protein [Gammaproteobacteria bacterium]